MKVIGTIEARMGSSRLPGKTLSEVHEGKSLLECVVRRFELARSVEEIVVATTTEKADDPIASWCERSGVCVFRGSEDDVLDRVATAAQHHGADAIVQMGADSAYLDFQLVDRLVQRFREGDFDYVCNDLKLTYPLGIYAHVVRVSVLAELNSSRDLSPRDREDVVRPIWGLAERYRIFNEEADEAYRYPGLRLTVDYPQDMDLARTLYAHFGGHTFTTLDIIAFYQDRPEVFDATRHLVQRSAPFIAG